LAGALLAILVRSRRAPSRERRKIARLALALGAGLSPFLLFGIVRTAVPAVEEWLRTPGSWGAVWVYGLVGAALAATPVLSTAAVLADRPFEHQVVLRRRGGWLGALASRVSRRAAHYDGRIARALERLSRTRGAREAIAGLSREIGDLLGAQSVAILLPDYSGSLVRWSNAAVLLRSDSGLAALVREAEEALDVSSASPLFALLPRADRDWLAANAVHLIGPLKRRDGEMAAVITIGPKTNGEPFDRRDRWLTVALLAAAVAAFDADSRSRASSERPGPRPAPAAALGEAAFECPLCGIVTASSPLPCDCGRAAALAALPHWVGKFRVKRRIGSGGVGVVYLAHDAVLDRDVALKTLPSLRPRAVERLRDEAREMAALNHESLATLYGIEIWRDTPVLVIEYFPNGTLAGRLSRGPLSPADTVALGIRLARALVYMHTRAVLHRDLKPSNIALTASGAGKLLDFGLATLSSPKSVDDEPSDAGGITGESFVGTSGYASPEVLRGEPASAGHDRWALAVVMLEAASGVNPFATGHRRTTRRAAPRAGVSDLCSESLGAVPEFRLFLERALAPSPEHRFDTSDAFLAALEDVADRLALRVR
jgi:serine/threonine-protein kinase